MKIFEKLGDWWLDFHGEDREEAHNQWLILKWSVIGLLALTGAWVWFEALKKDWQMWLGVLGLFALFFLPFWLWVKIKKPSEYEDNDWIGWAMMAWMFILAFLLRIFWKPISSVLFGL